jgi:hypothetical protein
LAIDYIGFMLLLQALGGGDGGKVLGGLFSAK